MGSTDAHTPALFREPAVYNENSDMLRRLAVGATLQIYRAAQGWSVEAAAVHAQIGHMTWRRVEDGYTVRNRTYAAIDHLLDQPVGTVMRALGDDLLTAAFARDVGGVDIADVSPANAAEWVERFAKSVMSKQARATFEARTSVSMSRPRIRAVQAPAPAPSAADQPDIVLAGMMLDRLAHRQLTPLLKTAMTALLDAMPDLMREEVESSEDQEHDARLVECR